MQKFTSKTWILLTDRQIKALPNGEKSQVGLANNVVIFDPYNQYNILDSFIANFLSTIWVDSFNDFFLTEK